MAEKDNTSAEKQETAPEKKKIGIITWVVMLMVIGLLSGSGFFLGRLLAKDSTTTEQPAAQATSEAKPATTDSAKQDQQPNTATGGTWYYNDLESVIVNPDEPGATRFVRVALILEVSNELSQEKAKEIIQAKSPLLINWLNLYFKSLSLAEMENDKDIKRILSQVCDGFNEILFPEAKPLIKNVLIREFNIQ